MVEITIAPTYLTRRKSAKINILRFFVQHKIFSIFRSCLGPALHMQICTYYQGIEDIIIGRIKVSWNNNGQGRPQRVGADGATALPPLGTR